MERNKAKGARIQAARAKTGLTQRQLAKKLGVSPQAVSRWVSGDTSPKLDTARRFAAMAGMTVEFLLSGQGDEVSNAGADARAGTQFDRLNVRLRALEGRLNGIEEALATILARLPTKP
jgi:transcriptional regulator with XRE-family HTH domain